MRGFDSRWQDVPHFIIGITREIWEERKIGSLRNLYADGLVVRSPASVVVDNSQVIAATLATLAEFPDRELLGEDVIWYEDATGATPTSSAYLSSHRLLCTATHSGAGMYGEPTGKSVAYRILADCAIRDNAVYDEWLVRDQGAIVQQLGFDVIGWTRDLIHREGGASRCVQPMTPDTLHYPTHLNTQGWKAADEFWIGLRAAFPDATFSIEHAVGCEDALMPPRAAIRWSLHGKHSGWGRYGKPTGAQVYIMGISHAEFGPFAGNGAWGEPAIRCEHTLIDDTAIWKQILLHTGQHE